MNTHFIGTIVLVIHMPGGAVHVGVDSRVVSIGNGIANVASKLKIHQADDILFAHAGIFKDAMGKIDVEASAYASIAVGGDLESVVDSFTTSIVPQLSAVLLDIRAQSPECFTEKLKRPLEMLFVSGRRGVPQVIVVLFEVIDQMVDKIAFRITRLRCPGDCPKGSETTISLGEHEAADRFLDVHPEILRAMGPAAAIQEAIAYQASVTPEFVSLPAVMVTVDHLGVHFLK